jgi:glyoxylase-like metal-dependent hydrolase (beta-lactamase superfamily II)
LTPELIQEGLWRIPLRMRLNPPYVNVYLLAVSDGWLLIDTGPPGEETWNELTLALSACGAAPERIRTILLTHAHPDHIGQAVALRERTGAPIWLHTEDAAMLEEIVHHPPGISAILRDAGAPPDLWPAVEQAHARLTGHFIAVPGTLALTEETTFATRLGPLEVLFTPGHAPGHCCLRLGDVVFSGDHVLPDTLPHAGFIPGRDALGDYLATLPRLRHLPVRLVLPSHGLPFDGWNAWLDRAEATHLRRLERVRVLRGKGLTPHEMVRTMWQRELRPVDYQLALTRVLGYLRHLEQGTKQDAGS